MKQPEEGKHLGGYSVPLRKKKNLHERQDILKTTTTKWYICSKENDKWLLVQIKEEKVFEIITNKTLTDDEKIEHHKKFNTQWGTVYSRHLAWKRT